MKKLLVILCSLALCMTTVTPAFAITEAQDEYKSTKGTYVSDVYTNPLYAVDHIENDDSDVIHRAKGLFGSERSGVFVDSIDEAGKVLRNEMVQRNNQPVVKLHMEEDDMLPIDMVMEQIFAIACEHTGISDEGDALRWEWKNWQCDVDYARSGEDYYLTFYYSVTYYTTADQEAALKQAIAQLKTELNINDKTELEKIQVIYDYICNNVVYDFTNLNDYSYDLKYTAYAALINKTSVCQGYAVLFYRLCLDYGIDARVISGYAGGEPHGWNIVAVGDQYYYVDATWDAGTNPRAYYLKGYANFETEHFCDSEYFELPFMSKYPIPENDFSGVIHYHNLKTTVLNEATCKEEGLQSVECLDNCSYYQTEIIPISEVHTLIEIPSQDATCVATGLSAGEKCSVCELITVPQTTIAALGHAYGKDRVCDTCGYTKEVIPVGTVKLSTTTYVYNGKMKSPKIIVQNRNGEPLQKGIDYKVTIPKGRKYVGKYTYTIKFIGDYEGTKKLTLTIKPMKTALQSTKAGKKTVTVKWTKVKVQATGYEVMYSSNKNFKKGS